MQAGDNGDDMFLNLLIRCRTKADRRLLKQVLKDRHDNHNMEDVNLSMAALQNMTTIDRKEKKRLGTIITCDFFLIRKCVALSYEQKMSDRQTKAGNTLSLSLDLLNNFCFHVCAQN